MKKTTKAKTPKKKKTRKSPVVANIRYDLTDPEGRSSFLLASKSLDLALTLYYISETIWSKTKYSDKPAEIKKMEEFQEIVRMAMDKYGVNLEEILS